MKAQDDLGFATSPQVQPGRQHTTRGQVLLPLALESLHSLPSTSCWAFTCRRSPTQTTSNGTKTTTRIFASKTITLARLRCSFIDHRVALSANTYLFVLDRNGNDLLRVNAPA